ncbi:transposase-like protein [Arthrobacter ginsengisoli]|uniref:Mutator family transposase n=1 Tax=Arthrobacter ginsengisoli TaxID=1356565 RepID=A0ABU1UIL1_9MICC|nr:transposase-like protein [Arthrobacter ginsengisoli]
MLTEIKNRGVEDVCITVCDGLKGLPEAITSVWEFAVVQTCIVHLIRNTFRYAARQYWDEMSRDLRPVYTAPSEAAAKERFVEFSGKWGRRYPAITRLWENAWSEFVPFLDYDVEIRRSFAAPTPSSPSTPGTGARSGPGVISPPNRRP